MTAQVAIALGANLGDAVANLVNAAERIGQLKDTTVVSRSSIYHSSPMGPADQPDYVNMAVLAETRLAPHPLLAALQRIETELGRKRGRRWGARTIDLDIIVYGDEEVNDEQLVIPHPCAHLRSFVLEPLAEIAPGLVIPGCGRVAELRDANTDGLTCRRRESEQG